MNDVFKKSLNEIAKEEYKKLVKKGSYPEPKTHDLIIYAHGIETGISLGLKLAKEGVEK